METIITDNEQIKKLERDLEQIQTNPSQTHLQNTSLDYQPKHKLTQFLQKNFHQQFNLYLSTSDKTSKQCYLKNAEHYFRKLTSLNPTHPAQPVLKQIMQ